MKPGHAIGRDAFLREEIILPLSKLFDDSEYIARRNAHMGFERLAESPTGWFMFLKETPNEIPSDQVLRELSMPSLFQHWLQS
jgi:hypothetical protein